jgi:hypothetical protein
LPDTPSEPIPFSSLKLNRKKRRRHGFCAKTSRNNSKTSLKEMDAIDAAEDDWSGNDLILKKYNMEPILLRNLQQQRQRCSRLQYFLLVEENMYFCFQNSLGYSWRCKFLKHWRC